jgi:hypothetical protein
MLFPQFLSEECLDLLDIDTCIEDVHVSRILIFLSVFEKSTGC